MSEMNQRFLKSVNRKLQSIWIQQKTAMFLSIVAVSLLCSSCASHLGTLWSPSTDYTVGGTVSGLTGTGLVLQDDGGNNLPINAGATSFTFGKAISSGGNYNVTVLTQPSNPTQSCAVTQGNGTVTNANITGVQVSCTTSSYTIGGTISGLAGAGLVLQDNGGNNLSVSAGATTFTFGAAITSGGTYNVTGLSQPSSPTQTCAVTNASGTVTNADVTSVRISCTTSSYTIGGTISGLTGAGLALQDNGGNNLSVSAGATSFTFTAPIATGGNYNVTVLTQPSNPTQSCAVANGGGTVPNANITSVQITCATNSYTIGGTISGLAGVGLVLQDNGGNNLPASPGTTSFTFSTAIASGGTYDVTALTQPSNPTQSCAVTIGSGTVTNANITTVQVNCIPSLFVYQITPSPASVPFGWTQQFTATIAGDPTVRAATWSVDGIVGGSATVGTISPLGLYNAPATLPAPSTVTVSAVDQLDTSLTASVSVQLTGLFAYVTNQGNGTSGGSLSAYSINAAGTLVPIANYTYGSGSHPFFVAGNPGGNCLYITDQNLTGIISVAIDPVSGTLSQVGALTTVPNTPTSIAINPSGIWLYSTSVNTGTIYGFSIDSSTCTLAALPGSPFPATGSRPYDIVLDPSGQFAFVTNNASLNISVFAVNSVTGQLTAVGSPIAGGGSPVWAITDAAGAHLYVMDDIDSEVFAYSIANTGALAPLVPPTYSGVTSPSFPSRSPNGNFLYVPSLFPQSGGAFTNVFVYSINPVTGGLAAVNGSPFSTATGAEAIAIEPSGQFAYVTSEAQNKITGFSLNSTTGAMTPLVTVPAGVSPSIIAIVTTIP
jgi:6-phosphogluconolactonase (cycloisomerase 2 family)